MRALLNFVPNRGGYFISFCDATATKAIGRSRVVKDRDVLIRVVEKMHGDIEGAKNSLHWWGQGSTWVDLSPEQCKFFEITS
jgi:hypothetical protein